MTETEAHASQGDDQEVFRFSEDELATLRQALRLLEATLSRDEADDLQETQRLLRRLHASPNL